MTALFEGVDVEEARSRAELCSEVTIHGVTFSREEWLRLLDFIETGQHREEEVRPRLCRVCDSAMDADQDGDVHVACEVREMEEREDAERL